MDEFPNPDEEFEALYAMEMEVMREMEGFDPEEASIQASAIPPSNKRSLDFSSPVAASGSTTEENQQDRGQVTSRKRPAEEVLFREEDHLFTEDLIENRKKKHRIQLPEVNTGLRDKTFDHVAHERDMAMIEHIVLMRKAKEALSLPTQAVQSAIRVQHRARVYRHPPDGGFQAITTESGQRCYLSCVEEEEWEDQVASVTASQCITGLLGISYSALKAQAQEEKIRRDALHAQRLQEEEDSGLESGVEDDDENSEVLWVEKFKPKRYLHLLSDEGVNRTVLRWIKLWDKVVFGKDHKITKKKKEDNFQGKPSKFKKEPEVIQELDDQNRPVQKVLLLCGPPGLGKTTLAHITARHAGYNVVEINASDDRSVDIFRSRLENATSMQAVLGPDPRPNCLVIDEIDGAPAPSINLLVNMLNGKDVSKKAKKAKGPILLQRPVVCICNELYTPALRPLRQMALLVRFPPTYTPRLAQRLLEISRKQHLKADLSVMMTLCDKTENDIRSCLSLLQFVRSTKNCLSMGDVCNAAVGQKDYQRSLFKIWQEIFSIPRQKRIRNNPLEENTTSLIPMPDISRNVDTFGEQNTMAFRFRHILKATQNAPYEKVMEGWFENYLNSKQCNLMESITSGLDWAVFTDLQMREIMHSQAWTLMAYLPYACVAHHLLFASLTLPKIQFPTQMNEVKQKLTKNQNLVTSMVSDMSPSTRAFTATPQLVSDVLPFLIHIIQPTLRPVNTQLYSKQEQQELAALIDTMISYNLTYIQEKDPHGLYSFNLDPNIGELVYFHDDKPKKELSYYSRQLISREIELEKVRRAEAYFSSQEVKETNVKSTTPTGLKQLTSSTQPPPDPPSTTTTATAPIIPNHLQKLQPVMNDSELIEGEKVQAPRDFFGRIVKQESVDPVNKAETLKSKIWFQYNVGYCNAVRKTIRMKDLAKIK